MVYSLQFIGYWLLVIVLICLAAGYAAWRVYRAFRDASDPCRGCSGCQLKAQKLAMRDKKAGCKSKK